MKIHSRTRFLVTAAIIAALYAALTYALAPFAFGPVQLRVSEIFTVLPFFTPAAIPGLFVGCIFGNMASPFGPIDIAVGSLATLLAALLTRKMPVWWLAPLPPVICNGVLVGLELHYLANAPLVPTMLYVALGEALVCFAGGIPFMLALGRVKERIFG